VAYSIDSSGVLDLFRYYPPDVFPTIWMQMDSAAHSGTIFAVDEVYRELERKDDDAFQWLKAHRDMVIGLDTVIQQNVTNILSVHPRLIDTRKNRSSGDPCYCAGSITRTHRGYRRKTIWGDRQTQYS
jgi:uncharacterized protein DUF4411